MNHPKTAALFGDNDALAMYVRLGVLAIERFADRTDDSFMIHDRELSLITGRRRADISRKSLRHLADISPISVERLGDVWRITFPNLSKRQGFGRKNGKVSSPPSSSASNSSSPSDKKEKERPPLRSGDVPEPSQPDLLGDSEIPGPGRMGNLLKGDPPPRLDGTCPIDKREWLSENWPLIWNEVEGDLDPKATDKQRNAKLTALTHRYWNHRKPTPPNGNGQTEFKTFEERDEERRLKRRAEFLAEEPH